MNKDKKMVCKSREKGKEGLVEKAMSSRYTNLPESTHVAFDVSRNTEIFPPHREIC